MRRMDGSRLSSACANQSIGSLSLAQELPRHHWEESRSLNRRYAEPCHLPGRDCTAVGRTRSCCTLSRERQKCRGLLLEYPQGDTRGTICHCRKPLVSAASSCHSAKAHSLSRARFRKLWVARLSSMAREWLQLRHGTFAGQSEGR